MRDGTYPGDTEGYLTGQWSRDCLQADMAKQINEYFLAIESGAGSSWLVSRYGVATLNQWKQTREQKGHEGIIADILADGFLRCSKSVAECEQCGRLWIQKAPRVNEYIAYEADNDEYNGIFPKLPLE